MCFLSTSLPPLHYHPHPPSPTTCCSPPSKKPLVLSRYSTMNAILCDDFDDPWRIPLKCCPFSFRSENFRCPFWGQRLQSHPVTCSKHLNKTATFSLKLLFLFVKLSLRMSYSCCSKCFHLCYSCFSLTEALHLLPKYTSWSISEAEPPLWSSLFGSCSVLSLSDSSYIAS